MDCMFLWIRIPWPLPHTSCQSNLAIITMTIQRVEKVDDWSILIRNSPEASLREVIIVKTSLHCRCTSWTISNRVFYLNRDAIQSSAPHLKIGSSLCMYNVCITVGNLIYQRCPKEWMRCRYTFPPHAQGLKDLKLQSVIAFKPSTLIPPSLS